MNKDILKPQEVEAFPERGQHLGTGSYKQVYVLKSDPTKALMLGISAKSTVAVFQAELEALMRVEEKGVPVLQIEQFLVDKKGNVAFIAERALMGSRGDAGDNYGNEGGRNKRLMDAVTPESLVSIKNLQNAFRVHDINIGDLQWLWTNDGRLVISDPLGISFGTGNGKYLADHFLRHEHFIRYALAIKSGEIVVPEAKKTTHWYENIYSTADAWWRDEGARVQAAAEKIAALEAAKHDIFTDDTVLEPIKAARSYGRRNYGW